jgi:hypothetical protein
MQLRISLVAGSEQNAGSEWASRAKIVGDRAVDRSSYRDSTEVGTAIGKQADELAATSACGCASSTPVSRRRSLMNRLVYGSIVSLAVLSAGCQISSLRSGSVPAIKQAKVDGATLAYLEQGQGVPVVFVHGAIADHRTWDAQRDPTARKYRYIAYDQRYFGPAHWPDDGKHRGPGFVGRRRRAARHLRRLSARAAQRRPRKREDTAA